MSPPRISRSGDPFDQALLRAGRNDGPPHGAEECSLVGLGLAAGLAAGSVVGAPPGALSALRWGGSLKGVAVVMALGVGASIWMAPSLRGAVARWESALRVLAAPSAPNQPDVLGRPAIPSAPIAGVAPPGRSAAAEGPWVASPVERAAPVAPEVSAQGSSAAPPVMRAAGAARALRGAPHPPQAAPSALAGAGPGVGAAPAAAASDAPQSAPLDTTPLSVEIALVQQAARAIAGGETSIALGLLDAYQRQCPHGVLVEEAGALRVEALARSGRKAEARALARELLDAHPHGVLAARLHAVLDGPSDADR
jgi:hypothetical protein